MQINVSVVPSVPRVKAVVPVESSKVMESTMQDTVVVVVVSSVVVEVVVLVMEEVEVVRLPL